MKLFSAQNIISKRTQEKGFTLIELLVVIGILGILAASLVATIDPFEQLKKANDTKVQNGAVEFQTANVRYYTGQNAFPWDGSVVGCTTGANGITADTDGTNKIDPPVLLEDLDGCLDELITKGELKSSFANVTGVLDKIYVTEKLDANSSSILQVCYKPTSKSGLADKAAIYLPDDANNPTEFVPNAVVGGVGCIANGGSSVCYWCTQ